MSDTLELESFADLRDHELALWGVMRRHQRIYSKLVIRGSCLGYVQAARLEKDAAQIRIAVRLSRSEEVTFGYEAMRRFETTVIQGVRKCLWGEGTWPRHTVEFMYCVELLEH